MKLGLFYDTETTGFVANDDLDSPRQPHLVQIAALLVDDDTEQELASINLTIAPNGWLIPESSTAVHGITTERALAYGMEERQALSSFVKLWRLSHFRVGHNEQFDAKIVQIAMVRYLGAIATPWTEGVAYCTGELAKPVMKMPQKRAGYKMPKLIEAYQHFTGNKLINAHDAMADTRACKDVYYGLRKHHLGA